VRGAVEGEAKRERLARATRRPADIENEVKIATENTPEIRRVHQDEPFSISNDCRSVRHKGETVTVTRKQSVMLKKLHESYLLGHPDVDKATLLSAIENETSRVQDTFKNSPLWQTLVVSKRKGTYRLNLPKHN
jgi:hypothetical protein